MSKNATILIYHHGDLDGICAAAVVSKRFSSCYTIKPVSVQYGDSWNLEDVEQAAKVFVVDFSFSENVRGKYAYLRQKLQSKGTKSAKRLLRKISRKERQFVTDTNHCISKTIVNMPYDIFALEDLTSIRVQSRKGKDFNRKLNSWAFYQLAQFLEY